MRRDTETIPMRLPRTHLPREATRELRQLLRSPRRQMKAPPLMSNGVKPPHFLVKNNALAGYGGRSYWESVSTRSVNTPAPWVGTVLGVEHGTSESADRARPVQSLS